MTLTKLVNGERVELIPEEAAEEHARWAAPPPPPPIPQTVSRFQARMALHNAGQFAAAEAAVAGSGSILVQEAWANAQEFRRDSPTILSLASALSLTDEDLDNLFIAAAQITA